MAGKPDPPKELQDQLSDELIAQAKRIRGEVTHQARQIAQISGSASKETYTRSERPRVPREPTQS